MFAEKLNVKNIDECHRGGANDKWQNMRDILVSTAEEVCDTHRNTPSREETWWWNDEVAKAVANKRLMFKTWQKSRTSQDKEMYCTAKQACNKIIAMAKRTKSQKLADEVNSDEGRRNVFRIAKQMAKVGQDIMNVNCLRNKNGKVLWTMKAFREFGKNTWRNY